MSATAILPNPKVALGRTHADMVDPTQPDPNGIDVRISREWYRLFELLARGGTDGSSVEDALLSALMLIPVGVEVSIRGTSNQITVRRSGNYFTLSLPQDIATTSDVQFDKVGIGTAPTLPLDIVASGNTDATARVQNTDSGASATASVRTFNGTNYGYFIQTGTGFTPVGLVIADATMFQGNGAGGVVLMTGTTNDVVIGINNGEIIRVKGSIVNFATPIRLISIAKASLPSAAVAGQMLYVPDEAGGAVVAFTDGTNWRRVTDRAIVS